MPPVLLLPLACAVVLIVAGIWWCLPQWQRRRLSRSSPKLSPFELEKMEDEYRKTLTQALGGVFVVGTLMIAYLQLSEAKEGALEQARTTQRTTASQVRASQFAKGFDLLGAKKAAERVGGIRVLDAWARERQPDDNTSSVEERYALVIPAMIALVRDSAKFAPEVRKIRCEEFTRPQSVPAAEDVRAALSVIGPWTQITKNKVIHLDMLNLAYADLSRFNLDGVDLSFTDLSGAHLDQATLRGADLYCANFFGAFFTETLFSTTPDGKQTNLAGAYIVSARLKGTDLAGANLASANMNETEMIGVDVRGADLFNTNYYSAKIDSLLYDDKTNFAETCFLETKFINTRLERTKGGESMRVTPPGSKQSGDTSHCFKMVNGLLVPDEH